MGEILIGPARSLSSKKPEERVRCRNLDHDVKHYKSSVNAIECKIIIRNPLFLCLFLLLWPIVSVFKLCNL